MDRQSIADALIEEGLLLSALEFHAELSERGIVLSSLKEFFEDPSNFDGVPSFVPEEGVSRSLSQATLDNSSLWAVSEDSSRLENDDKLAVLEFELRRAKDSLQTLKEELSRSRDECRYDPSLASDENDEDEIAISNLELGVINHLIYDYLLQNDYKLTSITFSDENAGMDFEEWDSQGLSLQKPPNIIKLFRDYSKKPSKTTTTEEEHSSPDNMDTSTISVQTEDFVLERERELLSQIESLRKTVEDQAMEMDFLNAKLMSQSQTIDDNEDLASCVIIEEDNNSLKIPDEPFPMTPIVYEYLSDKIGMVSDSRYNYPSDEDLSFLLGSSLPKIVPNVLLSKREELIPIIMAVVERHPDIKVRDSLLNILFNLIKKPDKSQRKMIIDGFLSVAKKFGPSRLESELLPHCWEQLNHKYPSRRTLVAETCCVLMPFIPSSLRNSLVYSMLQQLVAEDRDVEVRIASVKGLASLVVFMTDNDADKFSSVWKLTVNCLNDSNPTVCEAARESLLLATCLWCHTVGNDFESRVVSNRIDDLTKRCNSENPSWERIYFLVRTLRTILPIVISSVIQSSSHSSPFSSSEFFELNKEDKEIALVVSKKRIAYFQELISKEWFEEWKEFKSLSSVFIGGIIAVSSKILVSPSSEKVIEILILLMKDLVFYLGSPLLEKILKPSLKAYFQENVTPSIYISGLLPVVLLGLSRTPIKDMKEWILLYVRKSIKFVSIDFVIDDIISSRPFLQEELMEMIWFLLVNEDFRVRLLAGSYLKRLVMSGNLNYDFFSTRLLPGIVTLASDSDMIVRRSAVDGLGSAAVHPLATSNLDLSEKILMQFVSLIDDPSDKRNDDCLSAFIAQLGLIIPTATPKIRDQILLVKLTELISVLCEDAHRNNIDVLLGTATESYRNILKTCNFSKPLLRARILPDLKKLEVLGSGPHKESVSYMIQNVESMAQETPNTSFNNNQLDKLTSSPSMEEVKQKVGKIFNKPSWKK